MRGAAVRVVVLGLLVAVLPVTGGAVAQDDGGVFPMDTVAVGLEETSTPNVDVAVELSAATFADGGAEVVLIGRDDLFPDSLSSGVAQADGPLLLVPTDGPVPAQVAAEIDRLGAGRALVLGAEAAVSDAVVGELEGLGLTVQRSSGPTRIETAIETARVVSPDATTALLARSEGVAGNPTSGFADTLAAGGWAAATGWPVLLTQTAELTATTRAYLESSAIETVVIVGGTAAVQEGVADAVRGLGIEVRRVAESERSGTAVAVAAERGAATAAGSEQVMLLDGYGDEAWAAGFAAAARSALLDAPIVLANVDTLPPATTDWLVPGPAGITCATSAAVCDQARIAIGYPPAVRVEVPPGSVAYTLAGDDHAAVWAADFDGTVRGMAVPCRSTDCTQIDFTDDGDQLVVLHRQLPYLAVSGLVLDTERTFGSDLTDDQRTHVSIDAMTEVDGGDQAAVVRSDSWFSRSRISAAGQGSSGHCQCARLASFQASAPYFVEPEGNTAFLVETNSGDLGLVVSGQADEVAVVARRAGSQLLGAAWAGDLSGDIAIVDVVGGQGLLRIAEQGGDVIEVDDVDATSAPHWLAGDATIVVLADTADGVSLIAVDRVTGDSEVLVTDAGDAAAGRISGDASGTFIAWRTATDIRLLDTRDDSVAVITPPAGQEVVGGPVWRP